MRKRIALLALLLLLAGACMFGDTVDLTALEMDLSTLFTSIGQDLTPQLHQVALSGNDLVGEARLRGLTRVYLVVPGVSATVIDGVGHVLNSDDSKLWSFTLISIPDLIADAIAGSDDTTSDIYHMATEKAFPLPSLRVGVGFPLPFGMEFLGSGMYLPRSLVDLGLSYAGEDVSSKVEALGLELDMLTVGGVLRKNILSDKRGFFRPSLSLGASYTYSHFKLALNDFSLDALGVDPDTPQLGGTLDMAGATSFETTVQSFGALVYLSKNILWVLTPFAKLGAYYHVNNYASNLDVTATFTPDDDESTPEDESADVEVQDLNVPVSIRSADVSFLVSGGFEIRVLPITISTCLTLDLERPVITIDELDLNGFTLNGLSATLSLRLQI